MTTAFERTRALLLAGDLLERLRASDPEAIPAAIRDEAHGVLRHYPSAMEIGWLADSSRHWDTTLPLLDPDAVPTEIRKGYRR